MPIIEVPGVGPVNLPDGMSREQMADALNKLPKPKFTPTAENRGNVINSDVPTVVGSQPNAVNAQPQAKPITMLDRVKTLYEVPTAIARGITDPLYANAKGIVQSIPEAIQTGQSPAPIGSRIAQETMQQGQYQPSSPESQAVLGAIGETLKPLEGLPPYIGNIGKIPSAMQAAGAIKPILQESVIPAANKMAGALRNEAGMIKEAVTPTIQRGIEVAKPIVAKAEEVVSPVASKMASALRSEPKIDIAGIAKTAPSIEELSTKTDNFFKTAKESGVEINPKEFGSNMKQIAKDLEDIGYDAELHPDIAIVLKRLTDPNIPKDFNKIKALRTMIGDLQGGDTKLKRSIATTLKSDFDTYLATIPESSITAGSKEGLTAWKNGIDLFSKLSKSEVFMNMLENAELDKTKFSMSGAENSLSNQLRLLAKNPKKMRLFTKEEQEAIKQASKGTNTQNALRIFGKFAPTSAVSSIPALLTTSVSGPLGLAMTAGSLGARYGATKMRKSDINNLAAFVRAGGKKVEESK